MSVPTYTKAGTKATTSAKLELEKDADRSITSGFLIPESIL